MNNAGSGSNIETDDQGDGVGGEALHLQARRRAHSYSGLLHGGMRIDDESSTLKEPRDALQHGGALNVAGSTDADRPGGWLAHGIGPDRKRSWTYDGCSGLDNPLHGAVIPPEPAAPPAVLEPTGQHTAAAVSSLTRAARRLVDRSSDSCVRVTSRRGPRRCASPLHRAERQELRASGSGAPAV